MKKQKIIVVMPAYNAQSTIIKTYKDIPKKVVDEVLVVDDDSKDKTVEIAKKLKIPVFVHKQNLGYGGNQKTCYEKALAMKADIIVMIHPDYQYDATLTGEMVKPIIENRFDIMLGSRIRSRQEALKGGMPLYKYISNRFLTLLENIVLGLNLTEYHTGFRAFKKEVFNKLHYKEYSNDFIFDQQILVAAHIEHFRIGEIPVPVRYFPAASSINFRRSTKYGILTLFTLLQYIFHQIGLPVKIFRKK